MEKNELDLGQVVNVLSNVDYCSIAKYFIPVVVYCSTDFLVKKYKISRQFNNKPKIIIHPSSFKKTNIINSEQIKEEFKIKIEEFNMVLCEKLNHVNLDIYNFNIKLLIVDNKNSFDKPIIGMYYIDDNKIVVLKDSKIESIYHELFHLSSSYKTSNYYYYSGFSQGMEDDNEIGSGLTEGYTSLLEQRYFYDKKISNSSYEIEKYYASILEKIIGEKRMEQLYFKADLYNLISDLKEYQSENKIIDFLRELDSLSMLTGKSKNNQFETNHIKNATKKISKFLVETYGNKISKLYKERKILSDEALEYFNAFSEFSDCTMIISGKQYSNISLSNEINKSNIRKGLRK